ncbi:zinc finger protein 215-like [Oryx dammah]|uniref:zinc finger protein 215-like n=1 Tax=Oryx dammah TaxID=59534 RepID=UPI001A9B76F1|nr:zinc finger protein 215-like [Oryx dammah]
MRRQGKASAQPSGKQSWALAQRLLGEVVVKIFARHRKCIRVGACESSRVSASRLAGAVSVNPVDCSLESFLLPCQPGLWRRRRNLNEELVVGSPSATTEEIATLNDIAMDFTLENWEQLGQGQGDLFWDTALDNYQNLFLLNPPRPNLTSHLDGGEKLEALVKESPESTDAGIA